MGDRNQVQISGGCNEAADCRRRTCGGSGQFHIPDVRPIPRGGKKNHESLVYYVPALNIKSWEALKFDTEGLPEDWSLVIWNIKQFDRYNALFGIKAGDRLLKYIVDWLKKQTDPTYIYPDAGVWLGILLPNSEIPCICAVKSNFFQSNCRI